MINNGLVKRLYLAKIYITETCVPCLEHELCYVRIWQSLHLEKQSLISLLPYVCSHGHCIGVQSKELTCWLMIRHLKPKNLSDLYHEKKFEALPLKGKKVKLPA